MGGSNLDPPTSDWGCNLPGGFGGGPAYGANGGNGYPGSYTQLSRTSVRADAGGGGIGATALPPTKATTPGNGGTAGNGGGGGGANGTGFKAGDSDYMRSTCWLENSKYKYGTSGAFGTITLYPVAGGITYGSGSDGGVGADGIILLYWGGD